MRAHWHEGTWNWNGLVEWRVIGQIDPLEGYWTDYNENWEQDIEARNILKNQGESE